MIGAIIGDIIGSPYEWDRIKTTKFELFADFGDYLCIPTDDTVLTVATAAAILMNKEEPNFEKWYRAFYKEYPAAGYGYSFSKWADGAKTQPSFGNGSAMRVSPVAWAYNDREKVLAEARRSAIVSHGHEEGIRGAQATAEAIYLNRVFKDKEMTKKNLEHYYGYNLNEPLDSVRKWYKMDETCQGTVPYAFRCFYEADNYLETVRLAVSLGGDSDTLACIAGAMAEGMWSIPDEIVEKGITIFKEYYPDLADITADFLITYVENR
jgi:ADP-ribosylglycohydrolase